MLDNFHLLIPHLKFDSTDDFYYLQILQRKKENSELGSNSRVIRNYFIRSVEYLNEHKAEIVKLCDTFNARASLRLNRRSYKKVAFKAMQNLANTMSNGEYEFCGKAYDRACGQSHNETKKRWIVDLDRPCRTSNEVLRAIDACQPVGDKFVTLVPSPNGLHLITEPFNKQEFRAVYPDIEIHCDNPTNLYVP